MSRFTIKFQCFYACRVFNIVYLSHSFFCNCYWLKKLQFLLRFYVSPRKPKNISISVLYLHLLTDASIFDKRAATLFISVWSFWNCGTWKTIFDWNYTFQLIFFLPMDSISLASKASHKFYYELPTTIWVVMM